MKIIRSFNFWLLAACACLSVNLAQGLTIPAAEDTSSSLGSQQNAILTAKAGSATTLDAGPKQTAFIRFAAGSYADVIPATSVDKAWLMIYVASVAKAGDLKVHTVTADWTETVNGKPNAPTYNQADALATVPTASVVAKQFVLVDVTGQVKNWLTSPDSDFGFAISSDGVANVQLGSKDGPAKGYAAVLQIEKKTTTNTPEDDLRIIRGTVEIQNGNLTIVAGKGFTVAKNGGDLVVTFSTPFSELPSVSAVGETREQSATYTIVSDVGATSMTVKSGAFINGTRTHFTAIGPR